MGGLGGAEPPRKKESYISQMSVTTKEVCDINSRLSSDTNKVKNAAMKEFRSSIFQKRMDKTLHSSNKEKVKLLKELRLASISACT